MLDTLDTRGKHIFEIRSRQWGTCVNFAGLTAFFPAVDSPLDTEASNEFGCLLCSHAHCRETGSVLSCLIQSTGSAGRTGAQFFGCLGGMRGPENSGLAKSSEVLHFIVSLLDQCGSLLSQSLVAELLYSWHGCYLGQ